jgi:hypothetical protein
MSTRTTDVVETAKSSSSGSSAFRIKMRESDCFSPSGTSCHFRTTEATVGGPPWSHFRHQRCTRVLRIDTVPSEFIQRSPHFPKVAIVSSQPILRQSHGHLRRAKRSVNSGFKVNCHRSTPKTAAAVFRRSSCLPHT